MTDVMTAVVAANPVASPYKGLANFTEDDAAFFFGRARERDVIIANLRARRITVLYGPSGVGKTSLLRAGVVPDLLDAARESMQELGTPEFIPLVFSAWRDDPLRNLIEAIEVSAQRSVNVPLHLPRSGGLAQAVEVAADATDACLLVILDQFEEYFLYHANESGPGTFADELPRAIAQSGLQADFLISIREDAVAKLDQLKSRIPSLFDTFLRVEHLDAAAARAAIERPLDEYNAQTEPDRRMSVDSSLIDAVLAQVRTGQVVFEQAGHGTVQHQGSGSSAGDRIETPYLQLVMARLWDEETQRGSRSLTLQTLDNLGGAQEIVRTHLDAALGRFSETERYVLADLFRQLVTPSGTKIALSAADLTQYVALSEVQITELLETLARPETRIVRAVAPPLGSEGPSRYEIFHDVLATSILDWGSRQTAIRRAEEQRRVARAAVRRRVVRLGAVLVAAAFALILLLAIEANHQRNQARLQARLAGVEANRARQARALAMEVAAFQVAYSQKVTYITQHGHVKVLVKRLGVIAPKGTVVDVSCIPARCTPWRHTLRADTTRTIPVSTLADRSLPIGTHVIIFASTSDIAETITLVATRPGGLANTNEIRCRPAGSHIPGSDLSRHCLSVTSLGQAFTTKGSFSAATVRG